MPDIEIHRAHHLGLKAARAAADEMAEHLGRKFGLKGEWWGDVLRFERPGVSGTLTVNDKEIALSVTLGFLLKAMKSSIEGAIRDELDQLFASKAAPKDAAAAKEKPAAPRTKKAPARPRKGG